MSQGSGGEGCFGCLGCLGWILLFFLLFCVNWRTPLGVFNIDVFPPQIRQVRK